MAALVASAALLYAVSAPVLTFMGNQLVHDDPPERADAAIVLASGLDRVVEAAELFRSGYIPLILLTAEPPVAAERFLWSRGIDIESGEARRRRILEALGVPPSSIIVLEGVINSTADEAAVFARWAAGRPVRSLVVVTSPWHTARSRLTFLHAVEGRGVKVLMRPASLAPFRADTWWRSRATLREGVMEWQKLVYYQLVELRRR